MYEFIVLIFFCEINKPVNMGQIVLIKLSSWDYFQIMQMLQDGTKKNYVATLCTIFALVDVIGVAGFDCR